MQLIREKIQIINRFRENYIGFVKEIDDKINCNKDKITCHFNDLCNYFDKSLELLIEKPSKSTYQEKMFYIIGLLQTIYVQQDLTKEILRVFGCGGKEILGENYEQNRDIRNELIGHPISKESGKLKSSVFIQNVSQDSIQYARYSPYNPNSIDTEIFVRINDVISRHLKYLNDNLNCVLNEIICLSNNFINQINVLNEFQDSTVEFEKKIKRWFHFFYNLTSYEEKTIIECHNIKNLHPRYENYVSEFLDVIKVTHIEQVNSLNIFTNDCKRLINGIPKSTQFLKKDDNPDISLTLDFSKFKSSSKRKTEFDSSDISHSLGKLYDNNHPIWEMEFKILKQIFSKNKKVLNELQYLKENTNNDYEYDISYKYLRSIIYSSSEYCK